MPIFPIWNSSIFYTFIQKSIAHVIFSAKSFYRFVCIYVIAYKFFLIGQFFPKNIVK